MSTYEPLPGEDAPAFARRVFAALQQETGTCFWLTRRMGKRFSYVAGACREPLAAPKRVHLAGDWHLFLLPRPLNTRCSHV